jgi:hypothetical protein
MNVLMIIGFYGSKSDDLCLWTVRENRVNHMIIFVIYFYDYSIIGKEKSLTGLIDELKNHELNLKFERNFNEYLSCCIEESKDERKLTIIQPHLLTYLTQNFGDEIKGKRKSLTPGKPKLKVKK